MAVVYVDEIEMYAVDRRLVIQDDDGNCLCLIRRLQVRSVNVVRLLGTRC
jgi:hypothetical protein